MEGDKKISDKQHSESLNIDGINLEQVNLEEVAVDKVAYHEYIKLLQHPYLNEKQTYIASDGSVINIAKLKFQLTGDIKHLPQTEQNKILTRKTIWQKIQGKLGKLKSQAFGMQKGYHLQKGHNSLINAKQVELVELFGRNFSTKEAHEICVKDWGLPVSIDQVSAFHKKHVEVIKAKVEEYNATYDDIRLGYKKSRLEAYVWIYNQAKLKFERTKSREDLKVMILALDKIKGEVEDPTLIIKGEMNVHMDIEASVNMHLKAEVLKDLSIRQIIIGRVASKMNANVTLLVQRLTDSYYSKFTDEEVEDVEYEEVEYPSDHQYDFDDLQKANSDVVKEVAALDKKTGAEAYKSEKSGKEMNLKEQLLGLVKEKKAQVQAVDSEATAAKLSQEYKDKTEDK